MRTATAYNFLLEANVMASIAIVLMILVRKFLRKPLGNRVIYFAWLLVAIRLLCPLALPNPAINEIRPMFSQDMAIRPIASQLQVRFSDASMDLHNWADHTLGVRSPITQSLNSFVDSTFNGMLSFRLMQLYVLGLVLVICWFAFSNLRFQRRLRADRIEPISGKLLSEYQALCAERRVKPIPVYFVDPLPSACLVGVIRPYIALPLTAAPQEAISVLTHEVCHIKVRDNLWGLVRLLCCAIHWFNPLVWIAAHMSRIDGELACDDRVIRKLDHQQRIAYANILVLAASKRNAPGISVLATSMTMTGRNLKTRVDAIVHSSSARKGLAIAFAIVASMTLVGAFATAEYRSVPTIPQLETGPQTTEARTIASDEDAVAYAKQVWSYDTVNAELDGLSWSCQHENGVYYIDAMDGDGNYALTLQFNDGGRVTYLYNGVSRYDYVVGEQNQYVKDFELQGQMTDYLLNFVNTVNPGEADTIEAFEYVDDTVVEDRQFVTFYGDTLGDDGSRTHTLFVLQVQPEVRVVSYTADIPMDVGQGVG
ncbi:MAG: M56 family metallopeptidase [Eubacteriales bacterium]|nr:M56 family metallopeptidase [Eubacteriales bacterium]